MSAKLVPILVLVGLASAAAGFVGGLVVARERDAPSAAHETVHPGTAPATVVATAVATAPASSAQDPGRGVGGSDEPLPESLLEPVSARTGPAVADAVGAVPSLGPRAAERWSRALLDADPTPPDGTSARPLALVLATLRWAEHDPDAAVAAALEALSADRPTASGSSFDFELVNGQGGFGGMTLDAYEEIISYEDPTFRAPGASSGSPPADTLVRQYPDSLVRWLDARDAATLSPPQRAFVVRLLRMDGAVSADVAWGLVERAGAAPSGAASSGVDPAIDDWAVELAHAVHETDPERARRWMQERFAGPSGNGPVGERVWRLMPFDPDGALALIESVSDPETRSRLIADHADSLAANDPDAALALVSSLDGPDRSRALDAVMWTLSEASPERAVDALRGLSAQDVRAFPPASLEALVDTVARDRPDVVPGLVEALGDGIDGTRASDIHRSWSRVDPVAADAWASDRLSPDRYASLAADAAMERTYGDPEATLAAFATLPPTERRRHAAQVAIGLGPGDPDAARRWRDGLGDPAERVAANAGLWTIAAMERPDLAVEALGALDPSERLATFERAVPLVGRMDSRWLAGLADDDRLAPAERAVVERWRQTCAPEPF